MLSSSPGTAAGRERGREGGLVEYSSDSDESPLIAPDDGVVRVRMPNEDDDAITPLPLLSPHERFPKRRLKTLLACGMLMCSAVANDIVLSFVHERVPEQPPLPDILFSITPYYEYGLNLTEYIMLSCFACTLLLIFFHRHRWIVLRRLAVIGCLLYAGRCVTMLATQVPVADKNYYCSPKLGENATVWNVVWRALKVVSGLGLKLNEKHTLCGDYIYSGHTIVLVISALFINQYSPRRWRVVHVGVWLAAVAGMLLLIISRGHYSIDVIISYFICTRLFYSYHTQAALPSLRISPNNEHRKEFWYWLFEFMEGDIHRALPRRYDCPISMAWLAALRRKTNLQ